MTYHQNVMIKKYQYTNTSTADVHLPQTQLSGKEYLNFVNTLKSP